MQSPCVKYKEMMLQTAEALGLKRIIIPLPFLSINISSYWLNLFTPVPFTVAKALIEGLKSEVVIQNDNARGLADLRTLESRQTVLLPPLGHPMPRGFLTLPFFAPRRVSSHIDLTSLMSRYGNRFLSPSMLEQSLENRCRQDACAAWPKRIPVIKPA